MNKKSIQLFTHGLIFGAILLTSCNLPGTNSASNKKPAQPWTPGPAPNGEFDFKKSCGVDISNESSAIVYAQKLQSLNLVYEGSLELMNFSYRVEALATLDIQSDAAISKTTIEVKLNKIINKSTNSPPINDLALAIGARITANGRAGTTESTAIPRKDWLQLTGGANAEWKDLLCVATATRSSKVTSRGGNHEFEFTPGLAGTVNPMASPEQYKKELGNGRIFHITATVDRSNRPVKGTITYKPVSPTAAFTDPIKGDRYNVVADTAWEVTTEFDTNDNRFDDLTNTTTFYVSHSKKRFEAIVQSSPPSKLLGGNETPTVLLPLQ